MLNYFEIFFNIVAHLMMGYVSHEPLLEKVSMIGIESVTVNTDSWKVGGLFTSKHL